MSIMSLTGVAFGGGSLLAQCVLTATFAFLLPAGPWQEQPGYTAHQLISCATMIYVCIVGTAAWVSPDATMVSASTSTLSRLSDHVPVGEHLAQVLLGLNVLWDIPVGFIIESLRVRSNAQTMLVHHLVVVVLTFLAASPPTRFLYYGPFFFGLVEASSAPMSLMDLCHPRNVAWAAWSKSNAFVGKANAALRVVFAVAYMLTRVVLWPYVMGTGVIPDVIELMRMPSPPVSQSVLMTILVSASSLTMLQLYWAALIVQQATQRPAAKAV